MNARHRTRGAAAFAVSAGLHAAALVAVGVGFAAHPVDPPEPAVMELVSLDLGDSDVEALPEIPKSAVVAPAPPSPAPAHEARPRPSAPPSDVVSGVETPPLPASEAPGPADSPPPSASEAPGPTDGPPSSFVDWEKGQQSKFAGLDASEVASGGGGGARKGVDRCEPPAARRFEVVYLLFDSSASMSQTSGPNALTCARQYAKASLAKGATVVVVNFARDATLHDPTRSMAEVEIALRDGPDPTATKLPAGELRQMLDASGGAPADLVIVSDGIFPPDANIRAWYAYFFELNPDNRARLFTVGGMGAQESVATLRGLGFDVYLYDPLAG